MVSSARRRAPDAFAEQVAGRDITVRGADPAVASAVVKRADTRPTSLRAVLRRLLSVYDGWVAESQTRSRVRARLVDDARMRFDAARTQLTDHLPWCWRCGEHLRASDDTRERARDGIHARCYGR